MFKTSTFLPSENMQKVHLLSTKVTTFCSSASLQLRVYIRYKITLLIVWQEFCSHQFCVVAEVLGFCFCEEDFVAFLLGRNGCCWYRV